MSDPLHFLTHRQSIPSRQLGEPAPDDATLNALLEAAIRVPDHGKLAPWRLIVLRGEAKLELGRRLAAMALAKNPDLSDTKREKERVRFARAPLVIAVVSRIDPASHIPEQEQLFSAGCVAYNLLLGAQALGFGAQWLTGWAAYDRDAAKVLGLADHERVISFVHIGTPQREVPERTRPALADVVSTWAP
ncbi:MAG TPA: nitroreductase [Rhodanobacteraceae bacterium]